MSNSALVKHTNISPHKTSPRNNTIQKITIHHMAGNLSIEQCGNVFQGTRKASSNYGVGTDGRVGMYVEETDMSWASVSSSNDNQAVTIEVANSSSTDSNWPVSDTAYNATIDLAVDICWRNGIQGLSWTGDSSGTLTIHKFFYATACPGPYLESKMPNFALSVNSRLLDCYTILMDVITGANTLQAQGIISSPDYWTANFAAIEYLGQLIINMGQAPKNTTPVVIANVTDAINRLVTKGVISSSNYWTANYSRLLYLDTLLINVAKRLA